MNPFIAISAVAFWSVALAGGLYWTRRYVRAIEAKAAERERLAAIEARLAALEAARVDQLAALDRAEPLRAPDRSPRELPPARPDRPPPSSP